MIILSKLKLSFLIIIFALITITPISVLAQYQQITNSFIVSPSKQELKLGPGESVIRNIYITNKLGHDADFMISIEDVAGTKNEAEVIKYYGNNLGPYSIRNYTMVEDDRIHITAGETRVVPVLFTLPTKIKPGGLYGGVFVTAINSSPNNGTRVSTRIGSLIFLRIKGDLRETAEVKNFNLISNRKILLTRSPAKFQIVFENQGNIYLNPYGMIEIKNWRGRVVERLPIEPWFVYPDSVRSRVISWTNMPLVGYFNATLILNHGYSVPYTSNLDYRFFIFPLPLILGLLVFSLLFFVIYKIIKRLKKWQI